MTVKGSHGLTLFLLIAWDWLLQCAAFWDNRAQQLSKQMVFLTNDIALTNRYCCCQHTLNCTPYWLATVTVHTHCPVQCVWAMQWSSSIHFHHYTSTMLKLNVARLAENLQVDCRSVISHVHASCSSSFVLDVCVRVAGVD